MTKRLTVSHIGWGNENKVNFQGNIDFTQATVTGMPDHTPGITEYVDHIEVTKNLRAAAGFRLGHLEPLEDHIMVSGGIDFANATVTGLNNLKVDKLEPGDENIIEVIGPIDFSGATVSGFSTNYPSISEEPNYIQIDKP